MRFARQLFFEFREKAIEENPQIFLNCNYKIFSADYAQSKAEGI